MTRSRRAPWRIIVSCASRRSMVCAIWPLASAKSARSTRSPAIPRRVSATRSVGRHRAWPRSERIPEQRSHCHAPALRPQQLQVHSSVRWKERLVAFTACGMRINHLLYTKHDHERHCPELRGASTRSRKCPWTLDEKIPTRQRAACKPPARQRYLLVTWRMNADER